MRAWLGDAKARTGDAEAHAEVAVLIGVDLRGEPTDWAPSAQTQASKHAHTNTQNGQPGEQTHTQANAHTRADKHKPCRLTEPFAQAERARTRGGFPLRPSVPWRSRPRRGASGTACRACRSAVAATARGAQ